MADVIRIDGRIPSDVGARRERVEEIVSLAFKEYRKTAPTWAVKMRTDFEVNTEEGIMSGRAGDWLAMGPKGELWPIKSEIFAATYVPA